MEKIVAFAPCKCERNALGIGCGGDSGNDALVCGFDFSVIDSSLVGTSREHATNHSIRVTISKSLLEKWDIDTPRGFAVSEEMRKVAFQLALDDITHRLRKWDLPEGQVSPLLRDTTNSEDSCPYNLRNIAYPDKKEFRVSLEDQADRRDLSNVHPNIRVLLGRMDDALTRGDLGAVLHASASTLETMAKDVVGIPSVQGQTLKNFFDRYRKDSNLPTEILDYILGVYDLRSTTPLAGHGSTQTPAINRETAISLVEMTRAFVGIEYRLRQKQP